MHVMVQAALAAPCLIQADASQPHGFAKLPAAVVRLLPAAALQQLLAFATVCVSWTSLLHRDAHCKYEQLLDTE